MWFEMFVSRENFGLTLSAESIKKLEIIYGAFSHFVVAKTERAKTLLKILTGNEEFNSVGQTVNASGKTANSFAEGPKG